MNTGDLIKLLQEADPSGELPITVHGNDVWFVEVEPGYYDGPYEQLVRDETKEGYNIIGAQYRQDGEKLRIHLYGIEDLLLDWMNRGDEPPIEIVGDDHGTLKETVERWKRKALAYIKEANEWHAELERKRKEEEEK